jgi:acyl CoA:acetate/3-ketoacid CoA transferase
MYREQGRGMQGVLSKVGLGTFMDARVDAGCLNPSAKKITEELTAQNKEFIKYIPDAITIDIRVILIANIITIRVNSG